MKNKENILKWLNRELSEEETLRLKKSDDYSTLEKIAHYSQQIDTPKVDVEKVYADFLAQTETTKKQGKVIRFNFKNVYKYAAALVILCTTSYFLLFNTTQEFKTSFAETKTFALPDNSEVSLNSNSNISFSDKNWENNRNLDLEGEAFFKVAKGKKFTVKTEIGDVTVLGTEFNVKERDNYFEVKTYEGKVKVDFNNTSVTLIKGKLFRVMNNKIDTTSTFDISENSWLQKESVFKSTPLEFVLAEIENQFGYTIKTKNIDTTKLYSGGFSHKDINIALQSVTIPLQLSYKIDGKTITIYEYED